MQTEMHKLTLENFLAPQKMKFKKIDSFFKENYTKKKNIFKHGRQRR